MWGFIIKSIGKPQKIKEQLINIFPNLTDKNILEKFENLLDNISSIIMFVQYKNMKKQRNQHKLCLIFIRVKPQILKTDRDLFKDFEKKLNMKFKLFIRKDFSPTVRSNSVLLSTFDDELISTTLDQLKNNA